MKNYNRPVGWRFESYRHSLASKGIKTKFKANGKYNGTVSVDLSEVKKRHPIEHYLIKNESYDQLQRSGIKLSPDEDFDGDGVSNKNDCKPLNPDEQGILHDYYDKHILKKIDEIKDKRLAKKLEKAHAESQTIEDKKGLKSWLKKHKNLLIATGLTGVLMFTAGASGTGMLVQNQTTGQIVKVGATRIGNILQGLGMLTGAEAIWLGSQEAIQEAEIEGLEMQKQSGAIAGEVAVAQQNFLREHNADKELERRLKKLVSGDKSLTTINREELGDSIAIAQKGDKNAN